jgi:UDP-glucose 4-epimerase
MPILPAKILMTGATGFIGQHLAQRLVARGCEVSAIVLPEEQPRCPSGVMSIPCDITNIIAVATAIQTRTPTLIVHLAAVGVTNSALSFHESCRVNVQGTINILEAAHAVTSLQRLVLVGSSYEYGARRSDDDLDPFNAYGASKVAAWAYARAAYNAWNLPIVWVRPFQVYGPGQPAKTFIPAAISAALSRQDFRMTAGHQQRDFIYIEDVIDGMVAVLTAQDIAGRVIDLGTGRLTPLIDVVKVIWDLTQAQGRILAGALPYRPGEVSAIAANCLRTRLLTDWEAGVSLQQGLRWTIEDMRESLRI